MKPNDKTFEDIVLSTRVRLARNLKDYAFPARLSTAEKTKVNELLKNAFLSGEAKDAFDYIEMKTLSSAEAVSLAEKHLISPEFASDAEGRALILSKDEHISIMLNEEDHVRIQVIEPGLQLDTAFEKAQKLDNLLEQHAAIAFDERMGYLTQCPTNLGTALRASVMLHLPALARSGMMPRLSNTIAKLGLTLRGTYGEGSRSVGEIFQLSNQVTLGISEGAAIQNLASIAQQIITQEKSARASLLKDESFLDKIFRAWGILNSARMLSCSEFTDLVSLVRLGAAEGILSIDLQTLNRLLIDVQPATLNVAQGRHCTSAERDVIRAKLVRRVLNGEA